MRIVGALVLVSPLLVAALPACAQESDRWSGFYGGVQFGAISAQPGGAASGLSDRGAAAGVHAGYTRDLGDWVLGAEVDVDRPSARLQTSPAAAREIDTLARFKLRAGYDLGPTLLYATAGPALSQTRSGDSTGSVWGMGVSYEISRSFVMSGEYLNHEFSGRGEGLEGPLDAETISMRFSLRF